MKPNLVLYDKFRPENEARACEFLYMLSHFAPECVKFEDGKTLKGQEFYFRDVRRDPETGEIPPIATGPDLRNTHSITEFRGVNDRTNPICYRIHNETNDSE